MPPKVLYKNDFDREAVTSLPSGWVSLRGNWQLFGEPNKVIRQAETMGTQTCYCVVTWLNYAVRVKVRTLRTHPEWGVGVVAYWRDEQNHYRFMSFSDQLHLVKVKDGEPVSLEATPFALEPERWYWFKLLVTAVQNRVALWAKVWQDGVAEPEDWTLMAEDLEPVAKHGMAGLWCAKAVCEFDDFSIAVESQAKAEEMPKGQEEKAFRLTYQHDFEEGKVEELPSDWVSRKGKWAIAQVQPLAGDGAGKTKVLRQSQLESMDFEHNCYALVLGWRDYVVQAKMRCTAGLETWGMGLVGYWQSEERYYRLNNIGDGYLGLRKGTAGGGSQLLADAKIAFERGSWYYFKLALETLTTATRVRGKVWKEGDEEPKEWTLQVDDAASERYRGGTVGFVAIHASCDFDDVLVEAQPR